jgi:hypothetical protein
LRWSVNYKTTFKMLGRTWRFAQYQCDQSAGARFCGNDSEAAPLCSVKRLDTSLNERRVDYDVIQVNSGYCLGHLIYASTRYLRFDFLLLPAFLSAIATACF